MRQINEPIEVALQHGRPWLVTLPAQRRRPAVVLEVRRVLDEWVTKGKWWTKEEERMYFRIVACGRVPGRTTSNSVVVIYWRETRGEDPGWMLAGVED